MEAKRKNNKRRWGWLRKLFGWVFLLAVLGAIVWGFWPKPLVIETVEVTRGPLTVSVLDEGKTRIRERFVISPTVNGYLHRVALREGDRVVAGETVLAMIEAEPAGFLDPRRRAEAEAALAAAEAGRTRWQAEVERAQAALDLAKKEFERTESLRQSEAISDQQWDIAESEVTVLERALSSAESMVHVAEYEVNQARAGLLEAPEPGAAKAESLKIVSPIDGYVLEVFEENARILMAGTPIMELGDPNDLEAEIELLSSDAVAVQPGAEVSIERWGGSQPLKGRVSVVERSGFTKVSALGVEEQRVIVRVEFVDPMPPGIELGDRFRVEARIQTWHGDDVMQVPTGALFRRGNDWMTFTVENNKALVKKVEVGHNNGTAAEVLSGLDKGDLVVTHPPDSLADGMEVRLPSETEQ